MPLRKGIRGVAAATTCAAALISIPSTANAAVLSQNLTCTAQTVSSPLAKWGDKNSYWLAPGGNFEGSMSGWSLKNASVVSGNETLGVLPGSKSLKIGGGLGLAEVTTPSFCVDPLHPTFRFLVKGTAGIGATSMTTYVNFRSSLGTTLTVVAKLNTISLGGWSLSTSQPLSTAIPSVFLGSGTTASITFKTADVLNIDNLLIDPYRRG